MKLVNDTTIPQIFFIVIPHIMFELLVITPRIPRSDHPYIFPVTDDGRNRSITRLGLVELAIYLHLLMNFNYTVNK